MINVFIVGFERVFCMVCWTCFLVRLLRLNCMVFPTKRVGILTLQSLCIFILSRRRPLSCRNQSIDLLCKSMDCFLYDNGLRHERVKRSHILSQCFHLQVCLCVSDLLMDATHYGGLNCPDKSVLKHLLYVKFMFFLDKLVGI